MKTPLARLLTGALCIVLGVLVYVYMIEGKIFTTTKASDSHYTITLQDGVTLQCSTAGSYSHCGMNYSSSECTIEGGVAATEYFCQTNVTVRKQ